MKLTHLMTATAAIALMGGAAVAQTKNDMPKGPTPGSVTGDWNGAHAPSDDKQYQEKVVVPVGSASAAAAPPAQSAAVNPPVPSTGDATVAADASTTAPAATYTTTMVTNGPVPDTAENRAKYGQPLSRAGKRTAARGN